MYKPILFYTHIDKSTESCNICYYSGKLLSGKIQTELQSIDLERCDLAKKLDEIEFFKEMKPEVLGLLLYFNKIHNVESTSKRTK